MKKILGGIFFSIFVLCCFQVICQASGSDQDAVKKEVIEIPGVEGLPFSPAIRFGNMVFLSGVVGVDMKTGELVSPDVGEQTKQCLETLGLVLRQANLNYTDVLSVTVYLTDLKDFAAMNKAYISYFPDDPPARATVQVSGLVRGAKVEISMIAAK